jgi:hypothetical protein
MIFICSFVLLTGREQINLAHPINARSRSCKQNLLVTMDINSRNKTIAKDRGYQQLTHSCLVDPAAVYHEVVDATGFGTLDLQSCQ